MTVALSWRGPAAGTQPGQRSAAGNTHNRDFNTQS